VSRRPEGALPADARREQLENWLREDAGIAVDRIDVASADASFRRYFRVWLPGGTAIAMDAPPEHEDCRPFVHVAGLLRDAGLHAPEILARDLDEGFLLLSDLGNRTYLDVIDAGNADALFTDALEALVRWQCASRPGELPEYDAALLQRELDLFPDWYVSRHLGLEFEDDERRIWSDICERLLESALEQPRVFVHRDYMPRNLMVSDPNPGIIDFQDAVFGPIAYDVVSLFRDAFVSWEEPRERYWLLDYWQRARAAGLPVTSDYDEFLRAVDWMGLQRHLKVLGIFARLNYRDGKSGYLGELPRFQHYVKSVAGRYEALRPLADLVSALLQRAVGVGAG
jgi:hypothetical protein